MNEKELIRNFIDKNLVTVDDGIKVNDDDDIFKLGYVNSLFALKLLNFIEKQFSITIDNSELEIENFSTINNICYLVIKKIKK